MAIMRKYIAIIVGMLALLAACSDKDTANGAAVAGTVPIKVSASNIFIDRTNPNSEALALAWEARREAKAIQVEFATSPDFSKPVRDIGGVDGKRYTNEELASLVTSLGIPAGEPAQVSVRAKFIGTPEQGIAYTKTARVEVTLGNAPSSLSFVNSDETGQPGQRVFGKLHSLQNDGVYTGYLSSQQSTKKGFFRGSGNVFYGAPSGSSESFTLSDSRYECISFPSADGCYLTTVNTNEKTWRASLVERIAFEYGGQAVTMDFSPTQNAWMTSIAVTTPGTAEIKAVMRLKTYDSSHGQNAPLDEERQLAFQINAGETGQKSLMLLLDGLRPETRLTDNTSEKGTFASGGDISWMIEKYEHWGRQFYNSKGEATECTALMKEVGMNAIRLRVWVENPAENPDGWNTLPDVLEKAKRVRDQGMRLMVDFHYSDNWADPGQQRVPSAWSSYTTAEQRVAAVKRHTTEVLSELKRHGIDVEWVQVGNETKNGMLWDWGAGSGSMGTYAAFSNAGYDAVKSVYPDAKVIVHLENGWDLWSFQDFFRRLRDNGGKFDMIGMSYYPYWYNNLKDNANWPKANEAVAYNIRELSKEFGVDCMIVEIGYERSQPAESRKFLTDMFKKALKETDGHCAGIFYWEPEAFDYVNGAMTDDARPSEALIPFGAYKTY